MDWTCHILNTYLRYYDLEKVDNVIETIESYLKDDDADTLTIADIFFVVGDFSESSFEMESPLAQFSRKIDRKLMRQTSSVNFETLGFTAIADAQSTAFNYDQPATEQQSPKKLLNRQPISSSCNILCRDKMPSVRSAFRDALYSTKSPLAIYQQQDLIDVPSGETVGDRLCGYWGVVRQGLCHMAIPRDWSWGGPASEHCPVWVEVYCRQNRSEHLPKHNSTDTVGNDGCEEIHSTVSYQQLNGHHDDSSTNGNLNASSDSVFLSSNK